MSSADPHTRIAVTTRFSGDGMLRTYAVEADRDDFTAADFFQACKQLALAVGYDPKSVKEAFHG